VVNTVNIATIGSRTDLHYLNAAIDMAPPLKLAFILLAPLARISFIEAIRGDRQLRDERDRRLQAKKNAISDYYTYSQGRGGVSKQDEIPESPSTAPSIDLSTSERPTVVSSDLPSETPSVVPTLAPSAVPSIEPSVVPSTEPSERPSVQPSSTSPSPSPSSNPLATPSSFQYSYDDVSVAYNFVGSPQWPGDNIWRSELASILSDGASLTNNMMVTTAQDFLNVCENVSTIGEFRENPICVPNDDCQFQFCNLDNKEVNNLPAYSVDVRTPGDIIQALSFAERHNIQVSIKTTGHSKYI
jgi:hypothetical protein